MAEGSDRRRKLVFGAIVSLAIAATATSAGASVIQTFSISAPPGRAGKPIALEVAQTTADTGGSGVQAPPLRREIVRLNKGGRYGFRFFRRCKRFALLNKRRCSSASKVGTGRASAVALPLVPLVQAPLTFWNGEKERGHNTLYVYSIPSVGPNVLTTGRISKKKRGHFDYTLDFKIDPIQTVPGAPDASVTSVQSKAPIKSVVQLKRKGNRTIKRRRYLIVAPKTCPGRWYGQAEFHYQRTGERRIVKTVTGSIPCTS